MGGCATGAGGHRSPRSAGRVCPADYRIEADAFSGGPEPSCDTLFVVGGLYGNRFALDALDRLVAAETGTVHVVLNGDVHWFDRLPEDFSEIERRIARYQALVGNVEFELRRAGDVGAGCGCAYPDSVSDAVVGRSNRIHATLAHMLAQSPRLKEPLQGRASTAVARVDGRRVAVTHGDERLVGGWGCSRDSLRDAVRQGELDTWMRVNGVAVLATTHTCAPAAVTLGSGAVVNNGAAGMPNFRGTQYGLATRVGAAPSPSALYRACVDGVSVEAVPLCYDHDAYLQWFDSRWPTRSPAAVSYRGRIEGGPADEVGNALLGGFEVVSREHSG
ncbi:MAG: hypothetical protein LBL86_01400 [Coriobacteriales bacterium]|jgi:hypothetical protein|nr:hypothetical protein [Coriobacteriales bacterium]